MDRFTTFPPEGWPTWMANRIEEAKHVLVIVTELYAQRFTGKAPRGAGHGVVWEGSIITNLLYSGGGLNEKFIPVVFTRSDVAHIPPTISQYTHFCIENDDGYLALHQLLTGQPEIVPVPVGSEPDLHSNIREGAFRALAIPEVHNHASLS